jgi:hypothetical protein
MKSRKNPVFNVHILRLLGSPIIITSALLQVRVKSKVVPVLN